MPNGMAPRIVCESDGTAAGTFVHIEASDRLGLLYDILQTIADAGFNIKQARIETEGRVAKDSLLVTDERGEKLDAVRVDLLRVSLAGALS